MPRPNRASRPTFVGVYLSDDEVVALDELVYGMQRVTLRRVSRAAAVRSALIAYFQTIRATEPPDLQPVAKPVRTRTRPGATP